MKEIWTGKAGQLATRYGEHAPTAAVCCNACRACVQTNLVAIVLGSVVAAGAAVRRRLGRG